MSLFNPEPFRVEGYAFVPDAAAPEVFVRERSEESLDELPQGVQAEAPEPVIEAPALPIPEEPPAPTPEELVAEAFEKGREAGRAELPWQEADALQKATEALEEAARSIDSLRRNYLLEERRQAVEVAIAIAERILGRAIEADLDALTPVIERALQGLPESGKIDLRMSTADCDTLARGDATQLAALLESHAVTLQPDATLSSGDARVLVGRTHVDVRREELLRRVREELLQVAEIEEGRK